MFRFARGCGRVPPSARSIPMLLFFKDGKVVDQIVGAVPKSAIESKLLQHAA